MGELFYMGRPQRRAQLPAVLGPMMGVLGSSKGTSYATGGPAPATIVTPVSPTQVASVLRTLNDIANPQPTQRMSATGETGAGSVDKARRLRPPPPPPPAPAPPVYVALPYNPLPIVQPVAVLPAAATAAPGGAFPGGGGGGGATAGDDQGAGAADPAVFLGLTKTQLAIAGGLGLVAFFVLRKKRRHHQPAGEGL